MAVKPSKVVVELDQQQLLDLADRTWYKEAGARTRIPFKSEHQRAQYLRDVRETRDTAHRDLNRFREQQSKNNSTEDEADQSAVINNIYNYILYSYSFAYQFVTEAWLRHDYMSKISKHANEMAEKAAAAAGDLAKLEEIAKDAAWYRNMMKEYVEVSQGTHAGYFSRWMKRNNMKIGDLVKKYMAELKLSGAFKDLAHGDQIKVWNKVIEGSGRARFEITRDLTALGALGASVLLVTAGLLVVDIYTADNKVETAVKDIINLVASHKISVDGYAVKVMETVYGDLMPAKYKAAPAEVLYGEAVVEGEVTAEEAVAVASADGIVGDLVVVQVVEEGAETFAAVGEGVAAFEAVGESVTFLVTTEEVLAAGGILAAMGTISGPLIFGLAVIAIELVACFVVGLIVGALIDKIWEWLRELFS